MKNEVLDLVTELNEEVEKKHRGGFGWSDLPLLFIFESTGYYDAIKVNDLCLWDSENHHHWSDMEEGEFKKYVLSQLQKYADQIINFLKPEDD